MPENAAPTLHGTTILSVRKDGKVVIAGDGQVTFGNTILKAGARKVRPVGDGKVIAGFAGATADAFTLFERLEANSSRESSIFASSTASLSWRIAAACAGSER